MNIVRRSLYLGLFAVMAFGFPSFSTTPPFTECPTIGADTGCAILYVFNANGTVSAYADPAQGPYDGSDDTLVGVYNGSSTTQASLTLSGVGVSGIPIFGFEADGICSSSFRTFTGGGFCTGAYYQTDPGDYAGPANTFTNISTDTKTGTIAFTGGLAPGASTYFSLEDKLTATSATVGGPGATPAPASLILVLTGLAGALLFHMFRNSKTGNVAV